MTKTKGEVDMTNKSKVLLANGIIVAAAIGCMMIIIFKIVTLNFQHNRIEMAVYGVMIASSIAFRTATTGQSGYLASNEYEHTSAICLLIECFVFGIGALINTAYLIADNTVLAQPIIARNPLIRDLFMRIILITTGLAVYAITKWIYIWKLGVDDDQ